MAEYLFGGERWVTALEESKCGTFDPFQGDETREPRERVECFKCNGAGFVGFQFLHGVEMYDCTECDGSGELFVNEFEEDDFI